MPDKAGIKARHLDRELLARFDHAVSRKLEIAAGVIGVALMKHKVVLQAVQKSRGRALGIGVEAHRSSGNQVPRATPETLRRSARGTSSFRISDNRMREPLRQIHITSIILPPKASVSAITPSSSAQFTCSAWASDMNRTSMHGSRPS